MLLLTGVLHGVHWGLGHGSGELIGGFFISSFGASKTFAIFGALSLIDMGLYILVEKFASKDENPNEKGYQSVQSEEAQDEGRQ